MTRGSLADSTSVHHLENPVALRHTSCTVPRRSGLCPCWEGPLHRTNQALFVRLLAFLFVSDLPSSIPQFRLLPLAFAIIHRRTSLTLVVYAPAVAHSLRFCQFSSFRSPFSPRHRRRATACASPIALPFSLSPSSRLACSILVAYLNPSPNLIKGRQS